METGYYSVMYLGARHEAFWSGKYWYIQDIDNVDSRDVTGVVARNAVFTESDLLQFGEYVKKECVKAVETEFAPYYITSAILSINTEQLLNEFKKK